VENIDPSKHTSNEEKERMGWGAIPWQTPNRCRKFEDTGTKGHPLYSLPRLRIFGRRNRRICRHYEHVAKGHNLTVKGKRKIADWRCRV
jgi:hypothetical protein